MINKTTLFKYRMLEKRKNQKQLADELNISYNTINTWIAGETPIYITKYLKLLKILDISVSELINTIED